MADIADLMKAAGLNGDPEQYRKFVEVVVVDALKIVRNRVNQAIDEEWNLDETFCTAACDVFDEYGLE